MIKSILLLLIVVLSVEGASKPANKSSVVPKSAPKKSIDISNETYILAALDAQIRQKNPLALAYYETLYAKTKNQEYLYQALRLLELEDNPKQLSDAVHEALKTHPNDTTLKRFAIIVLLKNGKYAQAAQESLSLSEQTKNNNDYALLADSYLKMGNYQAGYHALKQNYDSTHSHRVADQLALLMYAHLGQKKEAIVFLKEHTEKYTLNETVGKRLASFYADSGDLDDAALLYEKIYDLNPDPTVAQEVIKIYAYQQNTPKLTEFLEKSQVNDPALLQLYVQKKEFTKASELAKKLYKQNQNPLYLAQSCAFAYEAASNKNDPLILTEVIDGLKQANNEMSSPLYLNYLGYLMIDHNLNITEGMTYVKKALDKEPDSPFYLDSLAWGYYKQGECTDALRLIKQVESMIGTSEDEVKAHLKAIEKCKTKEKIQ